MAADGLAGLLGGQGWPYGGGLFADEGEASFEMPTIGMELRAGSRALPKSPLPPPTPSCPAHTCRQPSLQSPNHDAPPAPPPVPARLPPPAPYLAHGGAPDRCHAGGKAGGAVRRKAVSARPEASPEPSPKPFTTADLLSGSPLTPSFMARLEALDLQQPRTDKPRPDKAAATAAASGAATPRESAPAAAAAALPGTPGGGAGTRKGGPPEAAKGAHVAAKARRLLSQRSREASLSLLPPAMQELLRSQVRTAQPSEPRASRNWAGTGRSGRSRDRKSVV